MGAAGQVPIMTLRAFAANTVDYMAFQGVGRHFFANHQTQMSISAGDQLHVEVRREVACVGTSASQISYSGHFVPAP